MNLPEPLLYYASSAENILHFHLLSVGEGLMVLIVFPDQTTLLYDCNILEDKKDELISYLNLYIPDRIDPETNDFKKWIDIFVNSHRDLDHYRGLREVNTEFDIKSIWDSGQTGATTQDADYQYYMGLRRRLIDKYGDKSVVVPAPSHMPISIFGGAEVYCLNSSRDYLSDDYLRNYGKNLLLREISAIKEVKVQHTNALVLAIKYAGKSLLLPSDSDWKAWKDTIIPKFSSLVKSNVLIASHHGSRSFFTDEVNANIDAEKNPETTYLESIQNISPTITLIPCGEYSINHHPNSDALELYNKYTYHPIESHNQVYTTQDKGTFVGYIDDHGHWTVCPSRFYPTNNSNLNFSLRCECTYKEEYPKIKQSGDDFFVGSALKFKVISTKGAIEPFDQISVTWEVSNGGIDNDEVHQDIYCKGQNETGDKLEFQRDVSYLGRHLLRCRLTNPKKNLDITKIFIVNGVAP